MPFEIKLTSSVETEINELFATVEQENGQLVINIADNNIYLITLTKNQFEQWSSGIITAIEVYEGMIKLP